MVQFDTKQNVSAEVAALAAVCSHVSADVAPRVTLCRPASHRLHEEAPEALCHLAAGQARHWLDPVLAAYHPAEHAAQAALCAAAGSALERPAAHDTHDVAAGALCHLPAGQLVHALEPVPVVNRPAGQPEHAAPSALVLDAGPNRPAAHSVPVHGCFPVLECVPAGQFAAAADGTAQVQPWPRPPKYWQHCCSWPVAVRHIWQFAWLPMQVGVAATTTETHATCNSTVTMKPPAIATPTGPQLLRRLHTRQSSDEALS